MVSFSQLPPIFSSSLISSTSLCFFPNSFLSVFMLCDRETDVRKVIDRQADNM